VAAWAVDGSSSRHRQHAQPQALPALRAFRILQTETNANQQHYLMIGGIELYSSLTTTTS
jgi:hypothetical protein